MPSPPTLLAELLGGCRSFLLAKGYRVIEAYGQLTASRDDA
jgi:hypothetical protein